MAQQQGHMKKTEETASPVLREVKDQGEGLINTVSHFAKEANEKGKELADEVRENWNAFPSLVKKHPLRSVLIGFGIGLLGGYLVKRMV